MTVLRKSVVGAFLVALAALNACTYWHGDLERICDESGRDFRRDPRAAYTDVDLRTITANPTAYKYLDVRFEGFLNRVGEKGFQPFWTTFDPENYISFSVWPAGAKLWQADERARSYPFLFLDRDSLSMADLLTAGRFSIVRIEAVVMGDFDQKAWFLVRRVEILEPSVFSDGALADLGLAKDAMAEKKPAVAIKHYENALGGIWTASLRLEIHLTLGRLYEGRGNLEAALTHYQGALTNAPDNKEAQEGVDRCNAALSGRSAAPQQ